MTLGHLVKNNEKKLEYINGTMGEFLRHGEKM